MSKEFVKVIWRGKEIQFSSIESFAKNLGVNADAVHKYMNAGMTCQELLDKYYLFTGSGKFKVMHKNIEFEVDGQTYKYDSTKEFGKSLGLSDSAILDRLRDGMTYEEIFEAYISTSDPEGNTGKIRHRFTKIDLNFEFNGKDYHITNAETFAKEFGIIHRKAYRALAIGMNPVEIIELVGFQRKANIKNNQVTVNKQDTHSIIENHAERKVENTEIVKETQKFYPKKKEVCSVNGKTFKNQVEACICHGVDYTKAYRYKYRHKCSMEDAINAILRGYQEDIKVEGKIFDTYEDVYKYYGLDALQVIEYRKEHNCTLEEAVLNLTIPELDSYEQIDNDSECNTELNEDSGSIEKFNAESNESETVNMKSNNTNSSESNHSDKHEELIKLSKNLGIPFENIETLAKIASCSIDEAFAIYIKKVFNSEYVRAVRFNGVLYKSIEQAAQKLNVTVEELEKRLILAIIKHKLIEYNGDYLGDNLVAFKCPTCGNVVIIDKYKLLYFKHEEHCNS